MANPVVPKKSSVAAKVPLSTDLLIGELAVNLTDRILYTKDSAGNVITLGGGGSSFSDTLFQITDNADPTKIAKFEVSGITTGTTQTYTLPNVSATLAHTGNVSQSFAGSVSFNNAAGYFGMSTANSNSTLGGGATLSGNTKTILIGSAGASGSTTNISLGSSVAGAINTITMYAVPSLPSQTAAYVFAAPAGSAGTPSFRALVAADIPALSYAPTAGSTSITTLGTVATGTWNATNIALGNGGTNAALTAVNGGIVYSNASAMAITAAGTAGQALISAGAAAPVWTTLTLENLPDAAFKKSVVCATTANITLSGTQTIDGIAVVAGNRVLVKDQTTASQNGIYVVSATTWTRSTDADTASKVAGMAVNVDSGTVNGGLFFDCDFKSTDTLGTTAIAFNRILDTGYLATWAGSSNVTTLGTVSTGTWNASTISVAKGGTGSTTLTGLVYGNGTSAMTAATAAQIVSAIGATAVANATNADTLDGNHASAFYLATNPSGYITSAGSCASATSATNATNTAITDDVATATSVYITWVGATSGNNAQKVSSTKLTMVPSTGTVTSAGNFVANSDERLKTNWRGVREDFVEHLAQLRSGVYDRVDCRMTQAGVSAQSLRDLLPEAVSADDHGILSVAYGNAAMVSVVELAKELVALRREVEELRANR